MCFMLYVASVFITCNAGWMDNLSLKFMQMSHWEWSKEEKDAQNNQLPSGRKVRNTSSWGQ